MDSALYWNDVIDDLNARDHTSVPVPGCCEPLEQRAPADQAGPTRTSRAGAIAMLAVHDAYFGIQGSVNPKPYLPALPAADPTASPQFAAAVACAQVLSWLYPKHRAFITEKLATAPRGTLDTIKAATYGRAVADALLQRRKDDALFDERHPTRPAHVPTPAYGHHRPDPTNPDQGFLSAYWGRMPFFATPSAVYLAPPPGMNADGVVDPVDPVYKVHHEEVFKRGCSPTSSVTTRTPEETVIGLFWAYDGAQKLGTPPRLYNRVVKAISKKYGLEEPQNVRLLTLVNVAMADAGIHAWFYKYHYDLWRPIVGIREYTRSYGPSAEPGAKRLPFTDPFWKPLGAPRTNEPDPRRGNFSPDFPAYPSGHATFGAAAMHITRCYLNSIGKAKLNTDGSDDVTFDFLSEELDGMARDLDGSIRTRHVRPFPSLLHAIVENSVSRVYLGVHWRFDGTTGGYEPDGSGSQPPSAVFDPNARLVVPRDHIGGVPLGLEIAEAIFTSGLTPSSESLAGGPPSPPSGAYPTASSGGKGGKKK